MSAPFLEYDCPGAAMGHGEKPAAPYPREAAWLELHATEVVARYGGQWIAVVDDRVVFHDKGGPGIVLRKARAKGHASPFVAFIPDQPIMSVHL
jgi:hypothetical protein